MFGENLASPCEPPTMPSLHLNYLNSMVNNLKSMRAAAVAGVYSGALVNNCKLQNLI